MKSKVLNRPMFKRDGGAMFDVENVGIMDGFKDDMEEVVPGALVEDQDEMELALGRTPDSPEILMNNLRGDMRSVDARVQELADLVGPGVAMETPTEVLALLQPVLAGPQGPMAAPPGMPAEMPMQAGMTPPGPEVMPMGMPPEAMPTDQGQVPPEAAGIGALMPAPAAPEQAPIQMRDGGYVQRFSDGSDEEGVRPADDFMYSPELASLAQQNMMEFLSRRPAPVPDLATAARAREPLYRELLGTGDKSMTQAQILFDIAQSGLNLAAGTDAEGRPLRGRQSPVSRFASAFSKVPGQIGARVAEMDKQERQIRLAAIQAGEKEVESTKEANLKLIESQRKAFGDILKNAAKADTPFGKGLKGSAYNTLVSLSPDYAMGKTTEDQDRRYEAAVKIVTEPEFFIDELGNRRMRAPELPEFASTALTMRGRPLPSTPALPSLEPPPGVSAAPGTTAPVTPTTGQGAAAIPSVVPEGPTLFSAAERGTGIVPVTASWLSKFPFMGGVAPGEQQAVTFIGNSINQLNRAIATNPRFAEGERQQIQRELDLFPKLIDNPEAFRNRLIGLDDLMLRLRNEAAMKSVDRSVPVENQNEARNKVSDIDRIRALTGVPTRVTSIEDFRRLPAGSTFLIQNPKSGALQIRTKR